MSNLHQPQPSPTEKGQTQRVISNSLALFVRVFVISAVNLFSVRFVLQGLGEQDYGIFNAVAGVVLTSSCLITVLASSIQRFYAFSMGQHDDRQLQRIFSASINIILVLSLLIALVFETVGLWFVYHKLTIPPDRLPAALFIFQFTLVSFVLSLFQIPFTAAVFAHEHMGIYALVSMCDCLLRFAVAYSIAYSSVDTLVFYGAGLMVASIITLNTYMIICRMRYSECRYTRVSERPLYRQLLSFSGWSLYGSLASVGMLQGSNILLNVFFGPLANAAFGIANNIYNAVNSVANSVVLPFRPPMIKMYAEQKYQQMLAMVHINSKVLLFLMLMAAIPLMLLMPDILTWWLGQCSADMVLFSRLFIVYTLCVALHNPITTVVMATGQIRNYSLFVETLTIMNVPLTYLLYSLGMAAPVVFVSMIGLCALAHIVRLLYLHHLFADFSVWGYFLQIIVPAVLTIGVAGTLGWALMPWVAHPIVRCCLILVVVPIAVLLCGYGLGLSGSERAQLKQLVSKKLK